jgi:hypothetical protein
MDMKRILQAMDGVATKPVAGASDMSKFLSIIDKNDVEILKEEQNNNKTLNEGANPHKVSLPVQMVMQHYQKEEPILKHIAPRKVGDIGKFFHEVEQEQLEEQNKKRQLIKQYSQTIAERVMMKESKISENEIPGHSMGFRPGPGGPGPMDNTGDGGHLTLGEKNPEDFEVRKDPRNHHQRRQHIHRLRRKMGWDISDLELLSDKELKDLHDKHVGLKEAPIEMDPNEPMNPMIYGHQGANPAKLKTRMLRASSQLKELAQRANTDDALTWEGIARNFEELAMNIEQIRHGISELAELRKKGGVKSRGIDKHIG